jgi:hypothetical protein
MLAMPSRRKRPPHDAAQTLRSYVSGRRLQRFVAGQRYLVTATNETVNGCGFSGPATAELDAAYSEAFPG